MCVLIAPRLVNFSLCSKPMVFFLVSILNITHTHNKQTGKEQESNLPFIASHCKNMFELMY